MCRILGFAVNFSSGVRPSSSRPFARIVSTFSGQGSMSVTSRPSRAK
jgi:hypothetical protein